MVLLMRLCSRDRQNLLYSSLPGQKELLIGMACVGHTPSGTRAPSYEEGT